MNRPVCRETNYRKKLDNIISDILSKGDEISWVLDMHSFPYYSSWYTSFRNDNYKMVFLYLKNSPFQEFQIFKKELSKYKDIGFLEGSLYNDIILTSIEKGIKSILIESLEDHNIFTEKEINIYFDMISEIVLNNI